MAGWPNEISQEVGHVAEHSACDTVCFRFNSVLSKTQREAASSGLGLLVFSCVFAVRASRSSGRTSTSGRPPRASRLNSRRVGDLRKRGRHELTTDHASRAPSRDPAPGARRRRRYESRAAAKPRSAGPADVIRALFPGGTITGAPKVRTMQVIAELEPVARGYYTGSLGWIGASGDLCLNIVIRSLWSADGRTFVQAGAGIVADSVPAREYAESLRKAQAPLLAAARAVLRP